MKKVSPETIVFHPSILVHDDRTRWAISFDSDSNRDMKRQTRTLWVLKDGITQLDVRVEGFDRLDDPDATLGERSIAGRIQLVASYTGGTTDSRLLAECALSPWAQHRALKPGDAVHDVAAAVRNGTAAAFTAVLPDLFAARSVADLTERVTEQVIKRSDGRTRSFGQRAQSSRLQRWKPWLAVGGVVACMWVFLSIFGKPAHTPEQPSLVAANPNLAALQLPQATEADSKAQVELVKQTLKSMGLDPGASGDTGCLVQPQ